MNRNSVGSIYRRYSIKVNMLDLLGSNYEQVNPKTIKLIFVAFLLSTQY